MSRNVINQVQITIKQTVISKTKLAKQTLT